MVAATGLEAAHPKAQMCELAVPGVIWVMQPPPSTPVGGGGPEDRSWAKIPDG